MLWFNKSAYVTSFTARRVHFIWRTEVWFWYSGPLLNYLLVKLENTFHLRFA